MNVKNVIYGYAVRTGAITQQEAVTYALAEAKLRGLTFTEAGMEALVNDALSDTEAFSMMEEGVFEAVEEYTPAEDETVKAVTNFEELFPGIDQPDPEVDELAEHLAVNGYTDNFVSDIERVLRELPKEFTDLAVKQGVDPLHEHLVVIRRKLLAGAAILRSLRIASDAS